MTIQELLEQKNISFEELVELNPTFVDPLTPVDTVIPEGVSLSLGKVSSPSE